MTIPRSLIAIPLLCACAGAQTPAPQPYNPLAFVVDPYNAPVIALIGASVASAKTDWVATVGGKQYRITPAEQGGLMLAGVAGIYAIRQAKPASKALKLVTAIVSGGAAAYLAGKAYANTLAQNPPSATTPQPALRK